MTHTRVTFCSQHLKQSPKVLFDGWTHQRKKFFCSVLPVHFITKLQSSADTRGKAAVSKGECGPEVKCANHVKDFIRHLKMRRMSWILVGWGFDNQQTPSDTNNLLLPKSSSFALSWHPGSAEQTKGWCQLMRMPLSPTWNWPGAWLQKCPRSIFMDDFSVSRAGICWTALLMQRQLQNHGMTLHSSCSSIPSGCVVVFCCTRPFLCCSDLLSCSG